MSRPRLPVRCCATGTRSSRTSPAASAACSPRSPRTCPACSTRARCSGARAPAGSLPPAPRGGRPRGGGGPGGGAAPAGGRAGADEADRDGSFESVGDMLFAAVNAARKLKVDPELALRASAERFRGRLEAAAELARANGQEWEDLGPDRQLDLYAQARLGGA